MFAGFDTKQILDRAINVARRQYNDGLITPERMQERAKYIGAVRSKHSRLTREAELRRKYLERTNRHLAEVRKGVSDCATFIAIDTGFNPDTMELQDLGVTTFCGEFVSTANYIVTEYKDQYVPHLPADMQYAVMDAEAIRKQIQIAYDASDFVVFHAAHIDKEVLGLNTTKTRYFDTAFISHRYYQTDTPPLTELCNRYSIDTTKAHNSGVDSKLTMQVLFALANDERKPYFYRKVV
jgi:DNA polymerase III epsilon subunit-like protein